MKETPDLIYRKQRTLKSSWKFWKTQKLLETNNGGDQGGDTIANDKPNIEKKKRGMQ